MTTGNDIVASARSWLGTRFLHQGRLKRTAEHAGGVDCLGLLIGVAGELSLQAQDGAYYTSLDETHYPHYPDLFRLRKQLSVAMQNIPIAGIKAGDVLLLRIDGRAQHLAIVSVVSGQLSIIHAYAPARKVVEHALDEWWLSRVEAAFSISQ